MRSVVDSALETDRHGEPGAEWVVVVVMGWPDRCSNTAVRCLATPPRDSRPRPCQDKIS